MHAFCAGRTYLGCWLMTMSRSLYPSPSLLYLIVALLFFYSCLCLSHMLWIHIWHKRATTDLCSRETVKADLRGLHALHRQAGERLYTHNIRAGAGKTNTNTNTNAYTPLALLLERGVLSTSNRFWRVLVKNASSRSFAVLGVLTGGP